MWKEWERETQKRVGKKTFEFVISFFFSATTTTAQIKAEKMQEETKLKMNLKRALDRFIARSRCHMCVHAMHLCCVEMRNSTGSSKHIALHLIPPIVAAVSSPSYLVVLCAISRACARWNLLISFLAGKEIRFGTQNQYSRVCV